LVYEILKYLNEKEELMMSDKTLYKIARKIVKNIDNLGAYMIGIFEDKDFQKRIVDYLKVWWVAL